MCGVPPWGLPQPEARAGLAGRPPQAVLEGYPLLRVGAQAGTAGRLPRAVLGGYPLT